MRKEDLQLGNWIKIPSIEYFNDEEDYDPGYAEVTSLMRDELNTSLLKEINYKDIEGIPLTEKILEKMGFKKDGYTNLDPDYFLELPDKIISINLTTGCNKDAGIWIRNKEKNNQVSLEISRTSLMDKIIYVHQFQNLLNLCGITNFIINLY